MGKDLSIISLALSTVAIDTEIKVRALSELLIEKEIMTMNEFVEKYKFVRERDFEKLKAKLESIIDECAEKIENADK